MKLTIVISLCLPFILRTNADVQSCFRRIINDVSFMVDEHAQLSKNNQGKVIRAVLIRMNARQRFASLLRRGCSVGTLPKKRTFDEYSKDIMVWTRNHLQETSPERKFLQVSKIAILFALHFEVILCRGFRPEILRPENLNMTLIFQQLARHYKRDLPFGGKYDQTITNINKFQCIHYDEVELIVNQVMKELREIREKPLHHGKRNVVKETSKNNSLWTAVKFLQKIIQNSNFLKSLDEIQTVQKDLNHTHRVQNVHENNNSSTDGRNVTRSRNHHHMKTNKPHKNTHASTFSVPIASESRIPIHKNKHLKHSNTSHKHPHPHVTKEVPTTLSEDSSVLQTSSQKQVTENPNAIHAEKHTHRRHPLKMSTLRPTTKMSVGSTPRVRPSKIAQGNPRILHSHQYLRPFSDWEAVKSDVFSAVMVDAILRGYILQHKNLPCPVHVISDLGAHFSHREHAHSTFYLVKEIENKLKIDAEDRSHHIIGHEHAHQHRSLPISNSRELRTASHNQRDACSTYLIHAFNISKPSVDLNMHNKHSGHEFHNYTMKNILKIYFNTDRRKTVSQSELLDICPALMMNIFTSSSNQTHRHELEPAFYNAEKYGIGTLCVFIISTCSLLGAILVKISHTGLKQYTLAAMIALSVSCLLGDAFVHLLPFALGIHDDIHHSEGLQIPSHVTKLLGLLAFFYLFIMTELLVSKCNLHSHHENREISIPVEPAHKEENVQLDVVKNNIYQAKKNNKEPSKRKTSAKTNDVKQNEDLCRVSSDESHTDLVDSDITSEACPSETSGSIADIKSLVWMIILGDAVHNLADGLAIGAAFAQNLTEGLSTCVAVLCHELPHELGDFAVLLNSGMSVRKALFWNLLSGIPAFIGLYIGLGAGSSEETRMWILAGGTGMFIYVALSKLVPEMLRIFNNTRTIQMFLALNAGLLTGFTAMFLLAVYEHDIRW